uniref:Uncharacterized protein n=1 Tax=Pithovirus LCPAC403 TaxID=2506596 RepID=A0A481ZC91_9VIRU|nr:MAG: hypothetical protein LCPAC403_02290 [Pithovirus LCPAC403]
MNLLPSLTKDERKTVYDELDKEFGMTSKTDYILVNTPYPSNYIEDEHILHIDYLSMAAKLSVLAVGSPDFNIRYSCIPNYDVNKINILQDIATLMRRQNSVVCEEKKPLKTVKWSEHPDARKVVSEFLNQEMNGVLFEVRNFPPESCVQAVIDMFNGCFDKNIPYLVSLDREEDVKKIKILVDGKVKNVKIFTCIAKE